MNKSKTAKLLNQKSKTATKKEKVAIYPGSFAPFHFGHLLVAQAALAYYDKLIILIAQNPNKANELQIDSDFKKTLIEKVIADEKLTERIQVDILESNGKVVNYLQAVGASILVRGFWKEQLPEPFDLQLDKDEEYLANRYLDLMPELRLHFIATDLQISSSKIRQALSLEKDVTKMIHPSIINEVKKTWSRKI